MELKIRESRILKLDIQAKGRDIIQVYLEDFDPGHGQITITCCGDSWTHYWPGMGDRKIHEFFCDCNAQYLIGKLLDYDKHDEFDADSTLKQIKKDLLKMRRYGIGNGLSKDLARDTWHTIVNRLEGHESLDGFGLFFASNDGRDIADILYGGDWYCCCQQRKTADYRYLESTIIPIVKAALVETFSIEKKQIDA